MRQFMMKDSYSFDIDATGLDVSYKKHYEAYCRIFDRCGLKYMVVEADSGAMGGKESHEFMVRTPAGEDQIVSCDGCNYAANMEKATSKLESVADLTAEGDGNPLEVHTPGQKTIEDVAKFLGVSPKNKIKTLAYMADEVDEKGEEDFARDRGVDAGRSSTERGQVQRDRGDGDSSDGRGRDQGIIQVSGGISRAQWVLNGPRISRNSTSSRCFWSTRLWRGERI